VGREQRQEIADHVEINRDDRDDPEPKHEEDRDERGAVFTGLVSALPGQDCLAKDWGTDPTL
jgi:hypothetical protein